MSNRVAEVSAVHRRGLLRVGEVIIPADRDAGLPGFAASGAAQHIDRMLVGMYAADIASVKGILTACAVLPKPIIRLLVLATERGNDVPGPIGAGLRMASIGLKGLVVSLYYAGFNQQVHQAMNYHTRIVERPSEPDRSLPRTEGAL